MDYLSNLFPFIFPIETVIASLHVASYFDLIPIGRKFSDNLVRFNFAIELFCIVYCFLMIDYGTKFYINYMMAFHLLFHVPSNLYQIFIQVDDFSQPFEGGKEKARQLVICWDSACHVYIVYCYALALGSWKALVGLMVVGVFFKLFPKEAIYE